MKTISLTALLLASALGLAGCNRSAAPAANNAAAEAPKPAESNAPAPAANAAEAEEEGGETAAPTASVGTARQNFSVVNTTGHVVMTLNVSPTSESEWGPDILGSDVLQSGQTAQVVFDRAESQCNYDLRVTYQDGDTSEMRNVNLCQTATVNLVDQ
ncbi:MAG TPA: hypothetical protein VEC11_10695 [Allosphingosinicella sp.]|nr:hypothetical protein [Allosphingosinicella sp.]